MEPKNSKIVSRIFLSSFLLLLFSFIIGIYTRTGAEILLHSRFWKRLSINFFLDGEVWYVSSECNRRRRDDIQKKKDAKLSC